MKLVKKEFVNTMRKLIPYIKEVSGGSELVCRCRYCDDSSDMSKAHMYIKVPQEDDDVPLYHCFKCNSSGVLDSKTMMSWGIYDPMVASELDAMGNRAYHNGKTVTKGEIIRYQLYNVCDDLQLGYKKVDFVNNRLGTNLTMDQCLYSKICLSLRDCIDFNRLQYTRNINILKQLNEHFVGFISHDNNFVNLRRMIPEGQLHQSIDLRYVNYNLHNNNGNCEKFYMLPFTGYDVNSSRRINVHIAEGPFDILSIKYNLNPDSEQDIFIAITGSSYLAMIKHILYEFKLFQFNLHLYPDNDNIGTDAAMMNIVEYLRPILGIEVYIHRNSYPGEKDFGVRKEKIIDNCSKI